MKIQKKLIVCLGIAMFIGLVSSITSYGMKRTRPETFPEESPNITQHKDIQSVISQKFQQFPMIQNAIKFLTWEPITLKLDSIVNSVATNGNIVVTGSQDGAAKMWNATTGQQLTPYVNQLGSVNLVAISGDIIASGSRKLDRDMLKDTSTVKIWKTNGELLHTFVYENYNIKALAISNNKLIVCLKNMFWEKTGSGSFQGSTKSTIIQTLDINTGKVLKTLQTSTYFNSVAMANDKLAIGLRDGTTEVWDINTEKLLYTLKGDRHQITDGAIAIADNKIVIGLTGNTKIWDTNTGKVLNLTYHTESIAIRGDKVVTGSYDDTAKMWDINTGELLRTFQGHTHKVTSVAIADNHLVTGSYDKTAKIWLLDPLNGTSETNPLLWIINNATVPQLDFIKRAYEATVARQEFILTIPSEDAKVFLSFPMHVKQYFLARLKIRR